MPNGRKLQGGLVSWAARPGKSKAGPFPSARSPVAPVSHWGTRTRRVAVARQRVTRGEFARAGNSPCVASGVCPALPAYDRRTNP